jgi:hypothetical protein
MTVLTGGGNVKDWELIQQIKENRKEQRWKKGDIVGNQQYKPLEIIGIENNFVVTRDTYGNMTGNIADDLEMICPVELRMDK